MCLPDLSTFHFVARKPPRKEKHMVATPVGQVSRHATTVPRKKSCEILLSRALEGSIWDPLFAGAAGSSKRVVPKLCSGGGVKQNRRRTIVVPDAEESPENRSQRRKPGTSQSTCWNSRLTSKQFWLVYVLIVSLSILSRFAWQVVSWMVFLGAEY